MRPVAQKLDRYQFPLDDVLGTVASVRVLRILVGGDELSYPALADRAKLNGSNTRLVIRRLENMGLVGFVGQGRQKRIQIREEHRLYPLLLELFSGEARLAKQLIEALRDAVGSLKPPPLGAWLTRQDEADAPATLCLLGRGPDVESQLRQLEELLPNIEDRFDVFIKVRGLTVADLETMAAAQRQQLQPSTHLYGTSLLDLQSGRSKNPISHAEQDARSLAAGKFIASLLSQRPNIVRQAAKHVATRLGSADERHAHELREWQRILDRAPAIVRKVLRDPGEQGTRLRQSNPFYQVLTSEERQAMDRALGKRKIRGDNDA